MKSNKLILILFFLAALVVGFMMSSCVTYKKCNEKFPPSRDTIRITQVRDSVVIRDTIIYIRIPGVTRVDSVRIPCPPPPLSYIPDTAKAETSFSYARAWWQYPNIRLKLVQKDTVEIVKALIKEAYHWKSEFEKITAVPQPVKYIPTIYKQALSACIFLFAIVFIWIVLKVKKMFWP